MSRTHQGIALRSLEAGDLVRAAGVLLKTAARNALRLMPGHPAWSLPPSPMTTTLTVDIDLLGQAPEDGSVVDVYGVWNAGWIARATARHVADGSAPPAKLDVRSPASDADDRTERASVLIQDGVATAYTERGAPRSWCLDRPSVGQLPSTGIEVVVRRSAWTREQIVGAREGVLEAADLHEVVAFLEGQTAEGDLELALVTRSVTDELARIVAHESTGLLRVEALVAHVAP